jgi:DNA-binding MarR family transcriptional regulator
VRTGKKFEETVVLTIVVYATYVFGVDHSSPSQLDAHLGYWLRCLSNFVSHAFAERLARRGLSVAQWVVLRTLYDSRGVTLNEGARRIGVDKSTLSRMVNRLMHKGWLSRAAGPDRRSLELKLTVAGRTIVRQAAKSADENDAAFFHPLTPRQRTQFLSTIRQLLAANGWDLAARGRDRME